MLMITTIQESKSSRIRLCGQFTAEYIPELEQALASAGSVALDLSNVTFVDREPMVFLCGARSKNIPIENVPSYVTRWIEQERRCGSSTTEN